MPLWKLAVIGNVKEADFGVLRNWVNDMRLLEPESMVGKPPKYESDLIQRVRMAWETFSDEESADKIIGRLNEYHAIIHVKKMLPETEKEFMTTQQLEEYVKIKKLVDLDEKILKAHAEKKVRFVIEAKDEDVLKEICKAGEKVIGEVIKAADDFECPIRMEAKRMRDMPKPKADGNSGYVAA